VITLNNIYSILVASKYIVLIRVDSQLGREETDSKRYGASEVCFSPRYRHVGGNV
jgi:hypothetical protein